MKHLIKRLILWISYLFTSPLILATWLEASVSSSGRIFGACKELLAGIPTPLGEYARLAFYRATCEDIAVNVRFMYNSMVARRQVSIRPGTVVGAFCLLGNCRIGRNVLIAAHVSVLSGKYLHGRPQDRINGSDDLSFDSINIGDGSWIGQGSILMANIGENCTVGAGSVVQRDVPDGATVMGNPARKVNLEMAAKFNVKNSE